MGTRTYENETVRHVFDLGRVMVIDLAPVSVGGESRREDLVRQVGTWTWRLRLIYRLAVSILYVLSICT